MYVTTSTLLIAALAAWSLLSGFFIPTYMHIMQVIFLSSGISDTFPGT
jgi:hypothetical protein